MRDADEVAGSADGGPASTALPAGTVPVIVLRWRARREHTDDHQVQLARELSRQGLAVAAEVDGLSIDQLEQAAARTVTYEEPGPFELLD